MVEIKPPKPTATSSANSSGDEESKFRLIYSKSKVYVNPTAYARDNIAGFVVLVKKVGMLVFLTSIPS